MAKSGRQLTIRELPAAIVYEKQRWSQGLVLFRRAVACGGRARTREKELGLLAWWMRAMPWWLRSPAVMGLTRSRAVDARDFWWRGNHGRWSEALVGGRWIGMDGCWLGEEAEEETRWACSSGHNGQRGHPRIRVMLMYR